MLREHGEAKLLALVVDDDVRIRMYVKTVLESALFEVVEARDGMEAIQLFRKLDQTIDLVVTDIRMPRMTGIQFAESLRSESPHTPLIFISAEPVNPDTFAGPDDFGFVEKPFAPATLIDEVRKVMPRRAVFK
ncbi:MAG TPA: response regulator [Bryobacteraceae bacterium]|nr:response regulator [Bryobacteraceae bacterium]